MPKQEPAESDARQAGRAAARALIERGMTPPPSFYATLAAAVRRRNLAKKTG